MTSNFSERVHIRIKADLVIELIDNFTQQLIKPCRMQFKINGRYVKPTRNKNGLLVFCNLLDAPSNLDIESDLYQKESIEIDDDELSKYEAGKYIKRLVRLEPSKQYSIPKWATVIEGTLITEDLELSNMKRKDGFGAVVESVSDIYRVKKNSEDGANLSIHITSPEIMEGRQFYESEGHPRNAFKIIGHDGDTFEIEPALASNIEAHALLFELKEFIVHENGHFMFVFPMISGDQTALKIYKDKEKVGEFQINAGKWNELGVFKI